MLAVKALTTNSMRESDRIAISNWAISYRDNPATLSRSPNQALAIKIHCWMSHGEWRTTKAIAAELKEPLSSVRLVMLAICNAWNYEVSRNPRKGYRRLN
jgi:hypothetical protein